MEWKGHNEWKGKGIKGGKESIGHRKGCFYNSVIKKNFIVVDTRKYRIKSQKLMNPDTKESAGKI